MSSNRILIHVISLEEIKFYSRFSCAFSQLGLKEVFVTTSLFCYCYLLFTGATVYISTLSKPKKDLSDKVFFNELVGWLSKSKAISCYYSMRNCATKIFNCHNVSAVIIPSGRLASHVALAEVSKEYMVPTIFSGYGNFPGKTFFDCKGTDRSSSLFEDVSKLDNYPVKDFSIFEEWRDAYVENKLRHHYVPQAKNVSWRTFLSRIFRIIFCKIENMFFIASDIDRGMGSIIDLIPHNISIEKKAIADIYSFNNKFCFFPLQYSLDAQIMLNYSGSYRTALSQALSIARKNGFTLIVKVHPVENSTQAIKCVEQFVSDNEDVYLSIDNTFKIINASQFVITVNSTVGLEARLMGKKTHYLGDSFYSLFNDQQMASYLLNYLIDIDYFSSEEISCETALKIFERCGVTID